MQRRVNGETKARHGQSRAATQFEKSPIQPPLACDGLCESLLDLSADGVLIVQSKTMVELNRQMAEMCGYGREALVDRPFSLLTGDSSADLGVLAAGIHSGGAAPLKNHYAQLRRRDGRPLPVKINAGQISYKMAPAALFVMTDMAAAVEMENELHRARQLDSIAALSGGIAHDYNNLLAVIIGNISLIQSYVDPQDMVFRLLNEVSEAAGVAQSLTQKLITFSRGGAPTKTTADLAALVRSVTVFSLSGSNIGCRFEIPDGLWLVEVDKSQVGQAIHNLVINAREAMAAGGTITVTAANVQEPDPEHGPGAGRWVQLTITDQGSGIAPENMDKIFNPYFSTKERGHQKGTGLGLSISHSIIHKHDGKMTLDSVPGAGTTVKIHLPASTKVIVDDSAPGPCKSAAPICGSGRILVMDDEEMIINMATRILARLGYETAHACNGGDAVDLYRQALLTGQPFDAVILDLTVRGGMGGEEAIRQLIEIDPRVKAIVSSGYSDSPVMQNYKRYGFSATAAKPYSLFELSRVLDRVRKDPAGRPTA
ncbi:MAG: ATP-binding protein [Desulfobacterales bacterium]